MSRLFREEGVKPMFKGAVGEILSTFIFIVFYTLCYSAGYLFGLLVVFFGMEDEVTLSIGDVEEDEMIKTMNEQGPNN
tara:strand:- start:464 stop:697 length:234 start_codon:yes stop_codon:yes gene_type:complete